MRTVEANGEEEMLLVGGERCAVFAANFGVEAQPLDRVVGELRLGERLLVELRLRDSLRRSHMRCECVFM